MGHIVWGRDVYRVLLGKPEEVRPLGRPRSIREDNIKTYFQDVGCGGMDWIDWIYLAQDKDGWLALVNEPSCFIICGKFLDYLRNG